MNYTVGYIKDGLASFLFFISIFLVIYTKNINSLKNLILIILIISFTTDFIFTLNIKYHHTKIGYNIPTFIILSSTFLIPIFTFIFRNKFKFKV